MLSQTRWLVVIAALVFTACGPVPTAAPNAPLPGAPTTAPTNAPTGAATSAPSTAPTTAPPNAPTGAAPSAPSTAPTNAPSSASTGAAFPLKIVSNSTLGQILVDNKGMTLYINKNDTAGKSSCYATCAQNWPPLVAASGDQATLEQGVSGKLGMLARTDGTSQVTFNDMPLYYYKGDTQPGDTKGQGINNIWFVLTSSLSYR